MTLSKAGRQPLRSALSRRLVFASLAAGVLAGHIGDARAQGGATFGLTPVFLDSDIQLLAMLEAYLARQIGRPVTLVKRRTYQEITTMLLSGQLDAAWICGFPYVQYPDQLALVAVPLYKNQPLYQSYVIVNEASAAARFDDLKRRSHAFSDPDSNSGFLVTRHLLAVRETTPTDFFSSFFFTYGHRNVIRAVGAGLAESGSVDGYVWDVVSDREPELARRTRVIRRSELLGFPPVACHKAALNSPVVTALRAALTGMPQDALGRELLTMLQLDGFTPGDPELFATIAEKWRVVRAQS
jgi:phosphonate transport system substrate-binding protein